VQEPKQDVGAPAGYRQSRASA